MNFKLEDVLDKVRLLVEFTGKARSKSLKTCGFPKLYVIY